MPGQHTYAQVAGQAARQGVGGGGGGLFTHPESTHPLSRRYLPMGNRSSTCRCCVRDTYTPFLRSNGCMAGRVVHAGRSGSCMRCAGGKRCLSSPKLRFALPRPAPRPSPAQMVSLAVMPDSTKHSRSRKLRSQGSVTALSTMAAHKGGVSTVYGNTRLGEVHARLAHTPAQPRAGDRRAYGGKARGPALQLAYPLPTTKRSPPTHPPT